AHRLAGVDVMMLLLSRNIEMLVEQFNKRPTCFFILTNSRSLTTEKVLFDKSIMQVSVDKISMKSIQESDEEINHVANVASASLKAGKDTLVMTSRQLITGRSTHGRTKVRHFESYCLVWAVCTGPPADRFMDHPLLGGTIDRGCFRPVTTRNRMVTVDFDHRWSISGSISLGRKKKEKKRENLEIRRYSPNPDLYFVSPIPLGVEKAKLLDFARLLEVVLHASS
ncbi:hypothetical protein BHE74_00021345, partial [Ensete ventricosum]